MISGLNPYSEYKASCVPWIESIPSHWRTAPGIAAFREKQVKNSSLREKQVLSLSYGKIIVKSPDDLHGLVPESFETYQIVDPGDIIIRSTDLQNDWNSLRVGLVRDRGIITSAYLCLKTTNELLPEFAYQLLHALDLMKVFYGMGSGLRQNLGFVDFKRMLIFMPPADEQVAIVQFLDYANRRIERFIRAKKRVLTLLNEQKQAVIQHAVTRGLDSTASVKPSGIPGIGDIPAHWDIRRLRTLVHRIDQGVSPLADAVLAEGGSWGVLKAGCVNHGVFRETEHKRLGEDFEIDPSIVVNIGDVLISRACGSPRLVGSVGKVESLNYRLILSDKIFRPVFRNAVDSEFMVYAMNSAYYRQQVEQAISGAEGLANNLPLSSLRAFEFAVPPLMEAKRVAAHLRGSLQQLAIAASQTEREIGLIREYRSRLIADVVTGQLDVREAGAALAKSSIEGEPAAADDIEMEETSELDSELESSEATE